MMQTRPQPAQRGMRAQDLRIGHETAKTFEHEQALGEQSKTMLLLLTGGTGKA